MIKQWFDYIDVRSFLGELKKLCEFKNDDDRLLKEFIEFEDEVLFNIEQEIELSRTDRNWFSKGGFENPLFYLPSLLTC